MFSDRAKEQQEGRKGPRCSAGVMLSGLDDAYRTEVEAAMADMTIWSTTIAQLLTDDGFAIAAEVLNRHRRGRCGCK